MVFWFQRLGYRLVGFMLWERGCAPRSILCAQHEDYRFYKFIQGLGLWLGLMVSVQALVMVSLILRNSDLDRS